MALFQSDSKDAIKRLSNKEFGSVEERDQLLAVLASAPGLKARDVMWMLFRPDRAIRDAGLAALQRLRDPETVDAFLMESRGKPEAAMRGAVIAFSALGLTGVEPRLAQLLAPQPKDTKELREVQETARRLLLELPMTKALEPVLWQQLETAATTADKAPILARLATAPFDERQAQRWQRLAADRDEAIYSRALEVLAKSPSPPVALFVERLATAGYATQQFLIEALTRAASTAGPEFIDQLLPLMASGDPATRTAVMKILLSLGQPKLVIRKYIQFAKGLAPFIRERVLDSLRAFGNDLVEPVIELLSDAEEDIRGVAVSVASGFDDPRIVPATLGLLKDPDWWIRIAAIDTLGKLKDPRAVDALVAALADPDLKWSAVEALGRIHDNRSLNALGRMLGDPQPDVRIEVMQALRHFDHPQVTQALMKIAAGDPERVVRTRAIDILDEMAKSKEQPAEGMDAVRAQALAVRAAQGEKRLNSLLIATRNQGASDFHLAVGQPPIVRMAADLLRVQGEPFKAEETEAMLREILTEGQQQTLDTTHQLDFCHYIPQAGRYRGNIFRDHRGFSAVFRVIPEKPPTMFELGLPAQLSEIADYHQGLVLVCGPSGSGKSTTLAALVNLFNETRSDHILTMEDPVEFVHPFKNCLVNQREVGKHTVSFARALRAALREDPDVIVIGELRDNESVSLALTAAETGHIVLGTINATSAAKAIDRIISSFPVDEQPQIRASISESLKYVIAQRLLPSTQRHRQVAAFEVLKGTSTIATLIRDEKTYQILSAMQIGKSQGMQTFDEALRDLVRRGQITGDTAYMAATKKEDFEALLSPQFLQSLKQAAG
ncbi:MAG TPA: PilT/PilU family type 4a pilus ATPase [Thermoanaerobaculia bacterium]|nr:PilT/PilU family type 4a pilus ATPase [Thermoanaerobaculia bacterium]